MEVKDIAVDDIGNLKTENFDFFIENSNQEHSKALFISDLGHWRQYPSCGIGLNNYLNSPFRNTLVLKNVIKNQFIQDKFKVQDLEVTFENDNLQIKLNADR